MAERSSNPQIAYAAEEDGTIVKVDEASKAVVVRYKDGRKIMLPIGSEATNNSANGFFVNQEIVVNSFKTGDKFKKGDVLTYNSQFFQADPHSKHVNWKIGKLGKVALIDNGGTIEDASIMTRDFAENLTFNPIHLKQIELTRDTNVHAFADVDQHVLNTEPIIVFDESAADFGSYDDPDLVETLSNFNRSAPKAGHTGYILKIEVLYKCPISSMSPSLQKIVRHVTKLKDARANLAAGCENASSYQKNAPLVATSKIGTIDLTDETVILRFYIRQDKGLNPGDKIFFDSALKSVVSTVYDEPIMTEDGQKVDACTSCRGVLARLITSPFVQGLGGGVLSKLEKDVIDIWNGKEPVDENKA